MKYQVVRSTVINADLNKVRSIVGDFKTWLKWSPWNIVEPECKMDFDGNPSEPGHKMSWDGEVIGSGVNTISSVEDNAFHYDLEFIKPFRSKAKVSFLFEKEGEGTKVTWTMDSSMPFFLFFMIPMMKAWIGMDYERGLRMLKAVLEEGKVDADTNNLGKQQFEGFSYVGIKRTCSMAEIGDKMSADFGKIIEDVVEKNNRSAKHWVSLYSKMSMRTGVMTYIAAVSDEGLEGVDLGEGYVKGEIKSGTMLEIKHRGSYDFIGNAWSMGMMIIRSKKLRQNGVPFEYYFNSPMEVKPNELLTSIYFPLKG